jgi:hypothetical protein
VLFAAVAGVYVDRVDRRLVLIATNSCAARDASGCPSSATTSLLIPAAQPLHLDGDRFLRPGRGGR